MVLKFHKKKINSIFKKFNKTRRSCKHQHENSSNKAPVGDNKSTDNNKKIKNEIFRNCCKTKNSTVLSHMYKKEIDFVENGNMNIDSENYICGESLLEMEISLQKMGYSLVIVQETLQAMDEYKDSHEKKFPPGPLLSYGETCIKEMHILIKLMQRLSFDVWCIRKKPQYSETIFSDLGKKMQVPNRVALDGTIDIPTSETKTAQYTMQSYIECNKVKGKHVTIRGKGTIFEGNGNSNNFDNKSRNRRSVATREVKPNSNMRLYDQTLNNTLNLRENRRRPMPQSSIVVHPRSISNKRQRYSNILNIVDDRWMNTNNSNGNNNRVTSKSVSIQFGKNQTSLASKLANVNYYRITNIKDLSTDESASKEKNNRKNATEAKTITNRIMRKNNHNFNTNQPENQFYITNEKYRKRETQQQKRNECLETASDNKKYATTPRGNQTYRYLNSLLNPRKVPRQNHDTDSESNYFSCAEHLSDHSLDGIESLSDDIKNLNKRTVKQGILIRQEKSINDKCIDSKGDKVKSQQLSKLKTPKKVDFNFEPTKHSHQGRMNKEASKRFDTKGFEENRKLSDHRSNSYQKRSYLPQKDKSKSKTYDEHFIKSMKSKLEDTVKNVNQLASAYLDMHQKLESLKRRTEDVKMKQTQKSPRTFHNQTTIEKKHPKPNQNNPGHDTTKLSKERSQFLSKRTT